MTRLSTSSGLRNCRSVYRSLDPHPEQRPPSTCHSGWDAGIQVCCGLAHFQPHSPAARLLRYHLLQVHRLDLTDMSYTVTDFKIDTLRLMLKDPWLTPEEHAALRAGLLEKLDPEERLRGLEPAEVLKCYAPEDRLRGLPPEERLRGLPPEEILRGMDPDLIKAWLKRAGH